MKKKVAYDMINISHSLFFLTLASKTISEEASPVSAQTGDLLSHSKVKRCSGEEKKQT